MYSIPTLFNGYWKAKGNKRQSFFSRKSSEKMHKYNAILFVQMKEYAQYQVTTEFRMFSFV